MKKVEFKSISKCENNSGGEMKRPRVGQIWTNGVLNFYISRIRMFSDPDCSKKRIAMIFYNDGILKDRIPLPLKKFCKLYSFVYEPSPTNRTFLVEQAGMPEENALDTKKVEEWVIKRMSDLFKEKQLLLNEIFRLRFAIQETIEENGHLADGDNCTLIKLKKAIGAK